MCVNMYDVCPSGSRLASCSITFSSFNYLYANFRIAFFLQRNKIPLYLDFSFSLSTHQLISIHLCCFHILSVVNRESVKMNEHESPQWKIVPQCIYLELVVHLGHVSNLFQYFEKLSTFFHTCCSNSYSHHQSTKCASFHNLTRIVVFYFIVAQEIQIQLY